MALIGARGVGKSKLVEQLSRGEIARTEDTYFKRFNVDHDHAQIEVLDTTSGEKFLTFGGMLPIVFV